MPFSNSNQLVYLMLSRKCRIHPLTGDREKYKNCRWPSTTMCASLNTHPRRPQKRRLGCHNDANWHRTTFRGISPIWGKDKNLHKMLKIQHTFPKLYRYRLYVGFHNVESQNAGLADIKKDLNQRVIFCEEI